MINIQEQYEKNAELLKAMAHPVRLCILRGLLDEGESNVSYIQSCIGVPQSSVSQHLQKLKSAGVIESRRHGVEIYYQVSNDIASRLMNILFA